MGALLIGSDVKPLWVTLGADGRVEAIGEPGARLVTAGVYRVSARARRVLRHLVQPWQSALLAVGFAQSGRSAQAQKRLATSFLWGKAGEIHLARGWALDLAEHGIRVNVVCPGNVFQGSKIWTEDYIKEIAKKRGIEPKDVIPHYIGLTALKQEITPQDIGEAVAFLVSSHAAKVTGQTLVVDGGQVFVR